MKISTKKILHEEAVQGERALIVCSLVVISIKRRNVQIETISHLIELIVSPYQSSRKVVVKVFGHSPRVTIRIVYCVVIVFSVETNIQIIS